MKKVLGLVAVAGLIAVSSAAFGATIVGSKHDLTSGGTATLTGPGAGSSTQICVYCHAPHNAIKSLPLWNRTNPAGTGFTLYSGVGMNNVSFKTGFTADSTSLFCMSCHDGSTNMNAIHNAGAAEGSTSLNAQGGRLIVAGVFANGVIDGAADLSSDLSKTHPINFPVKAADSQTDLWNGPAAGTTNQMGTGATLFPLFKSTDSNAARATTNRSLECGSCHAVHDSANRPFLRYTLAGSALCLGCHNK